MLPDFLCIGVYRAGTTWLQEVLSAHPDIFVPREKEIMFFSHHYANGLSWYENFFKNEDPEMLKGEICPTYFTHPRAAQRIHSAIPDARLIVILRNPVEQIHSLYKLWIRRGRTTWSLEKVVVKEPEFIANVMYSKNLRRYYNYFDKKNILVLLFDDLVRDKKSFIESIYRFLEVESFYPDILEQRQNISMKPRFAPLEKIIAKGGDYLRRKNLFKVKTFLDNLGIVKFIRRFNASEDSDAEIPEGVVSYIQEKTIDDIKDLSRLIGRDVSAWIH